MSRVIVMTLLLSAALHGGRFAVAQTEPSGASAMPTVPELDVVGSVRRMLEESRGEPQLHPVPEAEVTKSESDPAPETVVQPVSPPGVIPATAAPAGSSSEGNNAEVARPAQPRQAPANSAHVPVPVKEITIRSLDDLRALTEELDRAKAEKAQR